MEFAVGATTPSLGRCAARLAAIVTAWGLFDDESDPIVVFGAETSPLPSAAVRRGFTIVPALGPGPCTRDARRSLTAAGSIALLHPAEAGMISSVLREGETVTLGLPAPRPTDPASGLDLGSLPSSLERLLRDRIGKVPPDAPGITWVRGFGSAPLSSALEAWAAQRAVIALPQTPREPLLVRGGALFATSPLHAIEATAYLLSSPALTRTLAARGARIAARQPSIEEVASRLAEAIELARPASSIPARG